MTHPNTPPDPDPNLIESWCAAAAPEIDSRWPELPVLSAPALIERAALDRLIPVLRIKLGFPRDVFALAGWPLIAGFAEFVQLLPVPGSRRYGDLGGQLARGLARALRALDHRRGQILPRGAAPEIIGEYAHRWTYAVFAAALLRDVDKVCAGARVSLLRADGTILLWDPAAGPMSGHGAVRYRIETLPRQEPPSAVAPTLAATLFERCVPAVIRTWLSEDPRLLPELPAVLSGHADPAHAIGELVTRAATGSRSAVNVTQPVHVEPVPNSSVAASHDNLQPVRRIPTEPESLEAVHPEGSELAQRFMNWLRQGIASGKLAVNVPGALVHGVNEGLLLASPRIFRTFAKQQGYVDGAATADTEPAVEAGKRIQREVLRAGWHLRAGRGVNILGYEWLRDDGTTSRLNGIVIREPGRFVDPVPPVNRALIRVVDGLGASN